MVWLIRGLAFTLAGLVGGVACVALSQLSPAVALLGRHLLGLPLAGALLWFGAACLRRVTTPGGAWRAATRRCLWSAICVFFFSPFAYLLHRAPAVDYLAFNCMFFNLAGAVFVCCVNRLAFWLAEFHDNRPMALWARWSELFCYAALAVGVGVCVVATCVVAAQEGMEMEGAVDLIWEDLWPWLLALCLAPVCVTAAMLWTMKTVTLTRLATVAGAANKLQPAPMGNQSLSGSERR